MKYFLGILIFFAWLWYSLLISAEWRPYGALMFIDPIVIIGLLVAMYSVMVMTGEVKTFVMGVNAMCLKDYEISKEDIDEAIDLFELLKKTVFCASLLYCMMGIIFIMFDIYDFAMIGRYMAISVLSVFYGALINMAFLNPGIAILKKRR